MCEADRKLKKQLKQRVRGIRDVERQVAQKQDDEARMTRGYCLALREVLRNDGKYPLEPAGITLFDKLLQIDSLLRRAIDRRASVKLQRLRTILQVISSLTKDYVRLVIAWSWVHHLAHILDHAEVRAVAEAKLVSYATSFPQDDDPWLNEVAAHLGKLTKAFSPKLFAFLEEPLLPKTNNDLEVFIGQLKKDRRRVTGRKDTGAFILREGRAVALLSSLPSEPNWQATFAAIDIAHFQRSLADLRCAEQRSQAWQVRRDLQVYLTHLEQEWEPPMRFNPAPPSIE
ncbi:MAG: hypothetical protein KIT57_01165 [Blastocatellales bacterium]|nr:hypothetical protein [Blastocatellales bacterium]